MDHLLPLVARDRGLVVLACEDAIASDRTVGGLREQFRNRSRTATRGIQSNLSMVGRLAPWRRPSAALAIWSHKILPWATPLLALLAGACALALAVGRRTALVAAGRARRGGRRSSRRSAGWRAPPGAGSGSAAWPSPSSS
jgi:hypothetical protein